jgi:hypothetical protein
VPPPRRHLTRYHGVFAPHSRLRAAITPGGRGPGGKGAEEGADKPATPRHVAMSWAQRLQQWDGRPHPERHRRATVEVSSNH